MVSVIKSGDTVFVDGQGFSVAPSEQDRFIRDEVRRRGGTYVPDRTSGTNVPDPEIQQRSSAFADQGIDTSKPTTAELLASSDVQIAPERKGLSGLSLSLIEQSQNRERGQFSRFFIGAASGAASSIVSNVQFGKEFFRNPKETTSAIVTGIRAEGTTLLTQGYSPAIARGTQIAKQNPAYATGFVVTEGLLAKGIGSGLKFGGKFASKGLTRISPDFVSSSDDVLKLSTTKGDVEVKLAGGVSSTAEPVTEQVKLAGEVTTPVSAQRGLFGRFQNRIEVDKPLPTPDSPQLERSFFADPKGRVRTSRLGLQEPKEAGLTDILAGDFKFKQDQPQILVFPEERIADIPKGLSGVESKLLKGKPLSFTDQKSFEKFQLTPSGEFKPVGFISKEAEVTLAPKEVILREKELGRTIISGKPVRIIEASIEKTSKLDEVDNFRLSNIPETKPLETNTGGLGGKPISFKSAGSTTSKVVPKSLLVSPTGLLKTSRRSTQPKTSGIISPIKFVRGGSTFGKASGGFSGFWGGSGFGGFGGGSGGGSPIKTPKYTGRITTPKLTTTTPKRTRRRFKTDEDFNFLKVKTRASASQKRVVSTAYASGFNIVGKITKAGITSGLGIRAVRR